MSIFEIEQYVCKVCGFNMIGYYPERCPFCGAVKENFITAEQCSQEYEVRSTKISDKVSQLLSYPSLGLEHAAYRIDTGEEIVWIDCPSTFNGYLEPMDKIIFTHHHFLGASNLYHNFFGADIWIHNLDSQRNLAKHHTFNVKFEGNFNLSGIDGFHIDGHTQGFTFYVYENIVFICDYFIPRKDKLIFNPYGPSNSTREGAIKFREILKNYIIDKVCGFSYVQSYPIWKPNLDELLQ